MATDPDMQGRIDRAATAWLVRLGSPMLDDADRRAFRDWLDADPAHGAAFDEVRRLWRGLDAPTAALRRVERRRVGVRRLAAAAVLLVTALAVAQLGSGADHATAEGEQVSVTLADGSRMALDGDSAADVRIDDGARRVELRRGRAFFEVAPDPTRPFVVAADGVEAVALGTAFVVDRRPGGVEVVVALGRVAVRDGTGAARELAPGERVEATAEGLGAPGAATLETALAWRRGLIVLIVLEDRRLADVALELDRATGARVMIPQPSVRDLRLSGVFRDDDPAAVIAAIEAGLGLRTVRLGPATVIFR